MFRVGENVGGSHMCRDRSRRHVDVQTRAHANQRWRLRRSMFARRSVQVSDSVEVAFRDSPRAGIYPRKRVP